MFGLLRALTTMFKASEKTESVTAGNPIGVGLAAVPGFGRIRRAFRQTRTRQQALNRSYTGQRVSGRHGP